MGALVWFIISYVPGGQTGIESTGSGTGTTVVNKWPPTSSLFCSNCIVGSICNKISSYLLLKSVSKCYFDSFPVLQPVLSPFSLSYGIFYFLLSKLIVKLRTYDSVFMRIKYISSHPFTEFTQSCRYGTQFTYCKSVSVVFLNKSGPIFQCYGSGSAWIQQKVKEHMYKTVNSGLLVL